MTKTITNWLALFGALIVVASALFIALQPEAVKANLARFINPNGCKTATASTSPSFMTPGTATTTLTCALGNDGADGAVLALQFHASSTFSQLTVNVEESMDGVDFYPVVFSEQTTSSPTVSAGIPGTYQLNFASSSIGGSGAIGTNNKALRSLYVPSRMRYIRAYASLATTTGSFIDNGAVWMQILPKRED